MQYLELSTPGLRPEKNGPRFLVPCGRVRLGKRLELPLDAQLWASQGLRRRPGQFHAQHWIRIHKYNPMRFSGSLGRKCYDYLMAGLSYPGEAALNLDKGPHGRSGASASLLMNWFPGSHHKFKTLITHCGVPQLRQHVTS